MTRYADDEKPFTIGEIFYVIKRTYVEDIGVPTFLKGLRDAFDPLITPKENPVIDFKAAYRIRDQKGDFHPNIKLATNSPESVAVLKKYYEKDILCKIPLELETEIRHELLQKIREDVQISPCKKKELTDSGKNDDCALFLAKCTRFAVARKNTFTRDNDPSSVCHHKKFPLNEPLPISQSTLPLSKKELHIARALLDVLSERDHVTYDLATIGENQNWYKEIRWHLSAYLSIFTLKEQLHQLDSLSVYDPFEQLCNEIEIGIYPTYHQNYPDGYSCLNHVLEQALLLPLNTTLAASQTKWIGAIQKVGMCHYLLYKKRIPDWKVNRLRA